MASAFARGAAARGKRIAFGVPGGPTAWDRHSEIVFRFNPNVAAPGTERKPDIEWVDFRRGSRQYNRLSDDRTHWIWNYDFRAKPGEFFFCPEELRFGKQAGERFIVIEPNLPAKKASSQNKRWPVERYRDVAIELRRAGFDIVQLAHPGTAYRLGPARHLGTPDFRRAAAALKNAALYIGPEGGLHHACAAVGTPAVVLFGGFIPPQVTGYQMHTNLTGGATEACGMLTPCIHCRLAMDNISAEEVLAAALAKLEGR